MRIPNFVKTCFGSARFLIVLRFLFKVYFMLDEFNIGSLIRSRNVMRNLKIKDGERIFDAGCGVGLYSLRMAYRGAHVVSGDLSPLLKYSLLLGDAKLLKFIDFIIMDLNCIPVKSGIFDKIICIDVLEHISNDKNVTAEFSRILKNKGELVVHVPNLKRYVKLKNSRKAKEEYFGKLILGHVRNGYTLDQASSLFERNNIQVYDYTYTFGFWSRIAREISAIFEGNIIIFPLLFFLAMIDKASKTNEYNGGILIKGKRYK